jgi:shikimate kinase
VAHVIQLAVAPVFLVAGISGLLAVLTNRLARIIDRARLIEEQLETDPENRKAHKHERLQAFSKRARLMNLAITLCTACASMVCLLIIALFGGTFLDLDLSKLVALLFVGAMVALFSAFICFLQEVLLATRSLRIGGTTQT